MSLQSLLLGGSAGGGLTLLQAVSGAGLASGLQICVDAGDFQSFVASGTARFVNRVAGSGGFYVGNLTLGAESPTFNGPVGYIPAYFSANGSQAFAGNAIGAIPSHSTSASWSIFGILNRGSGGGAFCATKQSFSYPVGVYVDMTGGTFRLSVINSGGTVGINQSGTTAVSSGSWHSVGVGLSAPMGASGGFFYIDGNADYFTTTLTGENAQSASTLVLGAAALSGVGAAFAFTVAPTTRFSCFATWTRRLTKENFDTLRNLLRSRFGI